MEPTRSRPSLIDLRLLETLERAFARHAGDDALIDVADLQKALGLRSEYLARRVLVCLDQNGDGKIGREEFLSGMRGVVLGSDRDKLAFAFRLHDHDADGALGQDDLLRMIAISLAEEQVVPPESQPPEAMAAALLRAADTDRDGKVSFEEFEAVVRKRPELLRRMTRSEALWIAPSEDILDRLEGKKAPPKQSRLGRLLENRLALVLFVACFVAAHVVVFTVSMLRSAPTGIHPLRQIGRAFGACIGLDGALILFPVMRRLNTWVRATWLGRLVPVDDAIDFHRWVGHTMFFCALAHGASLLGAYTAGHLDATLATFFFHTHRGLTGTLLVAIFLSMWLFALEPIRRSRMFELFYFSHLLYAAWFVLVIIHAPAFALYAGVPLALFAVERAIRLFRREYKSVLVKGAALRSGVTRLDIQRPPKVAPRPGDYVFLNVPAIAAHEWHPFTLSSAPENEHLTVHVRTLGNWTAALRRLIEQREVAEPAPAPLVVKVDGPYGAPTTHVFDSRFAVLIAGGIGVTPFASILESIVRRAAMGAPSKLEKVHFFWLNRDQYSFEWFTALLEELEKLDAKELLEVHLCMTGGRTGATAVGLEIAREIMHEEGNRDLVTGLRTLTHMGHPEWDVVLDAIAAQHAPATVDVYFCGPHGLGRKIEEQCRKRNMPFREERF